MYFIYDNYIERTDNMPMMNVYVTLEEKKMIQAVAEALDMKVSDVFKTFSMKEIEEKASVLDVEQVSLKQDKSHKAMMRELGL
ncbi:hypothetical protein GTN31_01860 [Macrococcoides canis]|uniref:hypothetical protein n=1 Tax=Macrococcoides canis TaxID=1855823 RepID=UPI0013E98B88|nr:hypothetical protein [Macrococcus canis]QIH75091.1 hypothetical protein GTN31_01860 [Macrococcus canis]